MPHKILLFVLLTVALLLPAAGHAQDGEKPDQKLLIGVVTDSPDAFVGLALEGESVTLYICDGNAAEGTVSIAQWFVGDVTDNLIDITAPNGSRVEVALDEGTATGKFTFADGSTKEFSLKTAEDKAALFRSEFTLGEDRYVGGWLVLEDGAVRGAISNVSTGDLTPASLSGGSQVFQIDPID